VREQREAEQGGQVADAEQFANDRGRWRNRGQPGEAQSGGEQVERPFGFRRHQVERDQHGTRAVHPGQHVFAAVLRNAGAGIQAAGDVGEADDGQ
jgi:hypothetical protein